MAKVAMNGERAWEIRKASAVWWRWSKQLCNSFRRFKQEERWERVGQVLTIWERGWRIFWSQHFWLEGVTFEENPCCWSLLLLLVMRILNGVYWWFSFLLSSVGVGTHGFEKWGMTWINLSSSRAKPFLQWLPGWQSLVYWRGSFISWAGFFCRLITRGHDSKLKAKELDHCRLQGVWGLIQHH